VRLPIWIWREMNILPLRDMDDAQMSVFSSHSSPPPPQPPQPLSRTTAPRPNQVDANKTDRKLPDSTDPASLPQPQQTEATSICSPTSKAGMAGRAVPQLFQRQWCPGAGLVAGVSCPGYCSWAWQQASLVVEAEQRGWERRGLVRVVGDYSALLRRRSEPHRSTRCPLQLGHGHLLGS